MLTRERRENPGPTAGAAGLQRSRERGSSFSFGQPRRDRLSAEGLSAAVRDLHRPGDPRAGGGAALAIRIVSLRHPTDRKTHPITGEIRAPRRLSAGISLSRAAAGAGRLVAGAAPAGLSARRSGPGSPISAAIRTPNRGRRFGQALVLAAELPAGITRLHAHFLHTPASVARYAALMTGKPWSVSAHAKDIWTTPDWEKREKLAACDWLVTCTAVGAAHLTSLASDAAQSDPGPPRPRPRPLSRPDGPAPAPRRARCRAIPWSSSPSAGRWRRRASTICWRRLRLLPADLAWRFVHIGGGPLLPALKAQAESLGLAGRIAWRGAQSQAEILAALRARRSLRARQPDGPGRRPRRPAQCADGSRRARGWPPSPQRAGAIEELLIEGETGLLVPPGDPAALAAAIGRLIADPALAGPARRRRPGPGRRRFRLRPRHRPACRQVPPVPVGLPCA